MKKAMMIMAMVAVIGLAGVASADSILWLKADALSLADGATVTTWTDSSGNGNSPSTTLGTPIFKTNILNGKPVIRFDGASRMERAHNASLDATSFTIFSVNTWGNAGATECLITKGDAASVTKWEYLIYGRAMGGGVKNFEWSVRNEDGVGISDQAAVRGTTNWGTGSFHIGTGWFDKSLLPDNTVNLACAHGYTDGSSDTAGSTYHMGQAGVTLVPTNTGDLLVGAQGAADPRGFMGDVAEIAVVAFAASPQQILDVNAYLGGKYGIAVAGGGDPIAGLALLAPPVVVPEPAGLGLIGLALLAVRRRRS